MMDKTASQQIDDIIKMHQNWKGVTLSGVRSCIKQADPELTEEVKWKMATRPEGLAVWSHDGILCFAEIWKDNIKLLFPKGAVLKDTGKLFNSRLKSKTTRGVEIREGDVVDSVGLASLIREAVIANSRK